MDPHAALACFLRRGLRVHRGEVSASSKRRFVAASKVLLRVLAVTALATVAVGGYLFFSIWDTVLHGDERTQMTVAAETLTCAPSKIQIANMRAVGCGKACLLETTGSSASWWSSYTCVLEAPTR
jgi:hypothetical protein